MPSLFLYHLYFQYYLDILDRLYYRFAEPNFLLNIILLYKYRHHFPLTESLFMSQNRSLRIQTCNQRGVVRSGYHKGIHGLWSTVRNQSTNDTC